MGDDMDEHLMVETLVDHDDPDDLQDWLDGLPPTAQIIGPKRGTAAVTPVALDDEGNAIVPAPAEIPAKGDPARWYANVLSDSVVSVPSAFKLTDESTSRAVLGVWA